MGLRPIFCLEIFNKKDLFWIRNKEDNKAEGVINVNHEILVVEDDSGIRQAIEIYLKNHGFIVHTAKDGVEGLEMVDKYPIHLAVVDIMMPKMDGMTMTMKIREKYDFPIIFLSAKSEDIDKIMGLNIGADDYMVKPFASLELIARVKSQLRRYEQILNLKNKQEAVPSHRYIIGGLELDTMTKEAIVNGQSVRLRPKEYQILELLMSHPGQVFSAEEIYEQVWQEEAINTETIMVHVRKLREKIEVDPRKPQYLKVVWGIGYKIEKM